MPAIGIDIDLSKLKRMAEKVKGKEKEKDFCVVRMKKKVTTQKIFTYPER